MWYYFIPEHNIYFMSTITAWIMFKFHFSEGNLLGTLAWNHIFIQISPYLE